MSILNLGSVNFKSSTNDTDFYVSSIVESKSGFFTPRLITDSNDVDNFYGDFEYSSMYKSLIANNIPVLLLPVLTNVSEYNRCSLRLNSGIYPICNPKYKKRYKHISLGEIKITPFEWSELDVDNSITIHTGMPFYPKLAVNIQNPGLHYSTKYWMENGESVVKVTFPNPISGSITIESFPQIDTDSNYVKIIDFTGPLTIPYSDSVIPEVVVTDLNGNYVGPYVRVTGTELNIEVLNSSDWYQAHIRMIPSNLYINKPAVSLTTPIYHGLRHDPVFRVQMNGVQIDHQVTYIDDNTAFVHVSDNNGVSIIYNIITPNSTFNWRRLYSEEFTFNNIIDLSNIPYSELVNATKYNYFIIKLDSGKYLIQSNNTLRPTTLTSNYFDFFYTLNGNDHREVCKNLRDYLVSVQTGSSTCSNLQDLIESFLLDEMSNLGVPDSIDDFNDNWKLRVLEDSYSTDFWVASNNEVYNILYNAFQQVTSIQTDFMLQLRTILDSLSIPNDKLVIDQELPSQMLNHYEFENIHISQSFNLTQDRMSSLTENNKLVSFFSKIKGAKGKSITIDIKKGQIEPDTYQITISSGSIIEIYDVYCGLSPKPPSLDDYITLYDIGIRSELVLVEVYDYELMSGELIAQQDFDLFKGENEVFDPNRVRYIELFEGTWNLDRVIEEEYGYEDVRRSMEILSGSGWYPDLHLVTNLRFSSYENQMYLYNILRLIKGGENLPAYPSDGFTIDDTLYSQALINLSADNVANLDLVDENNRILYFYGDILMNEIKYPMFYPYLLNIINSEYLRSPSIHLISDIFSFKVGNAVLYNNQLRKIYWRLNDEVRLESTNGLHIPGNVNISDLSSIDKLLDEKYINYLEYNNLQYFYKDLVERYGQPSKFILQFITSKISRECYSNRSGLINAPNHRLNEILGGIVRKLTNLLPYISSLGYTYETNENTLNIRFTTRIKGITNKYFTINFIINN